MTLAIVGVGETDCAWKDPRPPAAEPLRKLDFCPVNDQGGAYVMTSLERAGTCGVRRWSLPASGCLRRRRGTASGVSRA